ncbi:MAG: hypothetical protein FWB72_06800 [Firmicutes bacterium]|nr:hypothetical protein [Bacillota bacterium]
MWDEFVSLWSGMSIFPAVFLALGLVLMIIEIFNPGVGIFGALGAILLILGIVIRVAESGSVAHLFMLVFIILLTLTASFLLMVRFMKFGWLANSNLVNNDTGSTLADDTRDGVNYAYLVGQTGISLTSLHPGGKAFINGNNYDVVTRGDFIEANVEVRVRQVEGIRIVVERN